MATKNTKKHGIGWLNVPGYIPQTWNPTAGRPAASPVARGEEMTERALLVETIEREAGNQPFIGKVAVGMVILERVKDRRWPDTITEVILQPMQFSCWNGRDPDHEKRLLSQASWAAADLCLSGLVAPTGYNHYWNPKLCNPTWAASLKERKQFGDHVFGKMG